jgi:hypothetical protein
MKEYFVFHKEWSDLREQLSMKVWYELETLMLQLRFNNIDTDPLTIKNKNVRQHWIVVRRQILNSKENLERKKNSRKNIDIQSNIDFDNTNIPSEQENVSNGQEIGKYGQMTPNELKNHLQGIQDAWEKRVS